jgi:hypothetical protein
MMKATVVADRPLSILQVGSAAGSVVGRGSFVEGEEGESECTSEKARGQFSIFGAVEENLDGGLLRIGTDQELFQRYGCKPHGGLGFGLRE